MTLRNTPPNNFLQADCGFRHSVAVDHVPAAPEDNRPHDLYINMATLLSAIAPVAFGVLALLFREHNKALVIFLVLWFASSAIQILWAFFIQRRNAHLAKACVGICVTQLAIFFLLFFRHLPLPT